MITRSSERVFIPKRYTGIQSIMLIDILCMNQTAYTKKLFRQSCCFLYVYMIFRNVLHEFCKNIMNYECNIE